ncbi:hypothetical protein BDV95DRAFT_535455 [Massariosphaeria phaeospora]|uniref:Uncharacterized protein n=1 Tax=Massariosphaeria phaeospora TaxID=100035 RepID=A0A7C8IJ56_9PLEO|nr:hypothetical protein BDV95DRAFT_535455 [Massariosphaeria phaeospora]
MPLPNTSRRKRPRPRARNHDSTYASKDGSSPKRLKALDSVAPPESHFDNDPSAAFWDSLSKIWLTPDALRELERRTTHLRPPHPQPSSEARSSLGLSSLDLDCASDLHLTELRRFARLGGPDLTDIRGCEYYYDMPPKSRAQPGAGSESDRGRVTRSRTRANGQPNGDGGPVTRSGTSGSRARASSRGSGRGRRGRGAPAGRSVTNPPTRASQPRANTSLTTGSSPYNQNFVQFFIGAFIYLPAYRYPDGSRPVPARDRAYVVQRLTSHRPSTPQWTTETYEAFSDLVEQASAETLKMTVPSELEGTGIAKANGGRRHGGMHFNNCARFERNGITLPTAAVPDLYWGVAPETIPRPIIDELFHYIIPGNQQHFPAAPNFCMEVKGDNGTGEVVKRQALHDGAIGLRAIHELESYGLNGPAAIGDVKALCATFVNDTLNIYAYHYNPPKPGTRETRPSIAMNSLGTWPMLGNPNWARQGIVAFRNALEYAREIREAALAGAISRHRDAA